MLTTHGAPTAPVKVVPVAACALVDADGRVLIAQRPHGRPMAGLWEFPGGKIEPGERPEQTLIRELKEELGIVVTEPCLAPLTFASHAYPDFHLLMPLFVCRRWTGTPTPLEGQTLKWVKPNALRDFPMPPADLPLISHLMALLAAHNRPRLSPAGSSIAPSASASLVRADPGAMVVAGYACGAHPESQTISNVARSLPSGSANFSA